MKDRIEEIFDQVMDSPDPLRRFAELVAKDALAQPKPWVGLTVDEIMSCGWWDVGFAKAIEAKLREKNHG